MRKSWITDWDLAQGDASGVCEISHFMQYCVVPLVLQTCKSDIYKYFGTVGFFNIIIVFVFLCYFILEWTVCAYQPLFIIDFIDHASF